MKQLLILGIVLGIVVLAIVATRERDAKAPQLPEEVVPEAASDVGPEPASSEPLAETDAPQDRTVVDTPARPQLTGVVELPEATPSDEVVDVVLREFTGDAMMVRFARDERWKELERTRVADDGSFALPMPKGAGHLRLELEGRFVFLSNPRKVGEGDLSKPVRLKAELGGALRIRLLPPAGTAFDPDVLRGRSLTGHALPSGMMFSGQPYQFDGRINDELVLECFGLEPTWKYSLRAPLIPFAPLIASDLRARPGEVTELDFSLVDGLVVRGRVVDGTTEEPVADADVKIAWRVDGLRSSELTTTDADGRFGAEGVQPGVESVSVSAPGFVPAKYELDELGPVEGWADLALQLDPGGSVAGTVVLPDERPVAGATVEARGANQRRGAHRPKATTDDEGRFEIRGLQSGTVELVADARLSFESMEAKTVVRALGFGEWGAVLQEGLEDVAREDRAAVYEARKRERGMQEWHAVASEVPVDRTEVVLQLAPPAGIRGRVVDDAGRPVPRFRLEAGEDKANRSRFDHFFSAHSRSFESDDGAFEWIDVPAGKWLIRAEAQGYGESLPQRVELPTASSVELVLRRQATLRGIVFDADGEPVPSAKVVPILIGTSGTRKGIVNRYRKSKDDGTFEITGVEEGEVILTAEKTGWGPSAEVSVQASVEKPLEGIELRLRRPGTLSCEVLDDEGKPVPYARITVQGPGHGIWDGQKETDAEGKLTLRSLAPEEYELNAYADGFYADARVTVVAGETTHVTIGGLKIVAAVVRGTVTAGAEPLANSFVRISPYEDLYANKPVHTDANGKFVAELERGGPSSVHITPEGSSHIVCFDLDVPETGECEVAYDLPIGGIRGRVLGGDGEPVRNPFVALYAHRSGIEWAGGSRTRPIHAKDASFELLHLPPGTYDLRASSRYLGTPKKGFVWLRSIRVEPGRVTEVEAVLPMAGSIEGTAVEGSGKPLEGVVVLVRDASSGQLLLRDEPGFEAAGSFVVDAVPPGEYLLEGSVGNWTTQEPKRLTVKAGEVAMCSLELVECAWLRVQLNGEVAELSTSWVSVRDAHGHERARDHESDRGWIYYGRRTARWFGPLPPGSYDVVVTTASGIEKRASVDLAAGDKPTVELELTK